MSRRRPGDAVQDVDDRTPSTKGVSWGFASLGRPEHGLRSVRDVLRTLFDALPHLLLRDSPGKGRGQGKDECCVDLRGGTTMRAVALPKEAVPPHTSAVCAMAMDLSLIHI